jgi:hypothetical protein
METKVFQIPNTFGKVFKLNPNPKFTGTELEDFVNAIVDAMSKARAMSLI